LQTDQALTPIPISLNHSKSILVLRRKSISEKEAELKIPKAKLHFTPCFRADWLSMQLVFGTLLPSIHRTAPLA
jgi:hypothetical protein